MAKKVFLGVGHGGKDPGATANGFEEADLNLAIALACRDELVRHGMEVKMSRTTDENDDLREEIAECNAYGPDLAIDIHNNAGGGDGAEVFCHIGGGLSRTLAQDVIDSIVKETGQNSRGVKTRTLDNGKDYYGFIRETKAPAIIVECAFVDHATDIKIIDTAAEQKTMGVAIAKGILKTLGITWKAQASAPAKDYAKHWAKPAIEKVLDKKIMNGYADGSFKPDQKITRAEVAQVIANLLTYLGK